MKRLVHGIAFGAIVALLSLATATTALANDSSAALEQFNDGRAVPIVVLAAPLDCPPGWSHPEPPVNPILRQFCFPDFIVAAPPPEP